MIFFSFSIMKMAEHEFSFLLVARLCWPHSKLGSVPTFSISWKDLHNNGIISFSNVCKTSPPKASKSAVFFVEIFLMRNVASLLDLGIFNFILPLVSTFVNCVFKKSSLFSKLSKLFANCSLYPLTNI